VTTRILPRSLPFSNALALKTDYRDTHRAPASSAPPTASRYAGMNRGPPAFRTDAREFARAERVPRMGMPRPRAITTCPSVICALRPRPGIGYPALLSAKSTEPAPTPPAPPLCHRATPTGEQTLEWSPASPTKSGRKRPTNKPAVLSTIMAEQTPPRDRGWIS